MSDSNDSFTETTTTGWFSRMGKSITGILIGGILALVAFPVLWWNEGRSVKTAKGLEEGAKITIEADAASVSPANESKLVHVIGKVETKDRLADPEFGFTTEGQVKLKRYVEIYQWQEDKNTKTKTKLGGGEETVTTYTYSKGWDHKVHESSSFHNSLGHSNPQPMVRDEVFTIPSATLGAYRLSDELLNVWSDFKPHPLPAIDGLPETLKGKATIADGWLILSSKPGETTVGDARVKYESIPVGEASVLARQVRDTFESFATSYGTSIARITSGASSKDAMFASAQSENTVLTWIFRAGSFIAMFIGLALVLAPLKVLADVVPFIGSVVGFGTTFMAFILSTIGTCITIALAWLYYRPLLGISLLLVAGGALYMLRGGLKKASA
jgi:Transmembrane protein 43